MIKKTTISIITSFILFIGISESSLAQVTIEDGAPLDELLVQLLGNGISIDLSTVSVTCRRQSYGKYKNEYLELPLDSGIVLSSGEVEDISSLPAVLANSTMGTAGDADLTAISGNATNDACILTFDVVPFGNEIFFSYTFASEEYRNGGVTGVDDFTGCPNPPATFNDVFAFFITGPNPSGGNYTNFNLATVPTTGEAVGISTVNQCTNEEFYQDNLDNINFVYDAYTRNLVAKIAVEPCQTYTISLRIADGGDSLWDSAVFIEDVNSNAPALDFTTNSSLEGLLEECTTADVDLTRIDSEAAVDFKISIGGSATITDDYDLEFEGTPITSFPYTFSYGIGEFTKSLEIIPKADGIVEGTEEIKVYLEPACGGDIIDSLTFTLYDKESFSILEPEQPSDLYRCETTQVIELPTRTVDNVTWSRSDGGTLTYIDGDPNKGVITEEISTEVTYTVNYDIGSCIGADGFTEAITVIPSYLEVDSDVDICEAESVMLAASGRESYTWSATPADPTITCLNAECSEISATPTASTVYEVTGISGTPEQCNSTETITVTVIIGDPPTIDGLRDNLRYCTDEDTPFQVTGDPAGGNFELSFGGAIILSGYPLDITPSTLATGAYTLTYTIGTGGSCSEETTRIFNVVESIEIEGLRASLEYCNNESVSETLSISSGSTDGVFALIDPDENSQVITTFNPNGLDAGVYRITYTTGNGTDCDAFAEKTLTIVDPPTIAGLRESLTYCGSENIDETLTAGDNSGNFALVNTTTGTSTPLASAIFNPNGLTAGIYTITYTVGSGLLCDEFDEETITIVDAPEISGLRVSLEYCNTENIDEVLGLSVGNTDGVFTLTTPSGSTTNITIFNPFDLEAGTYTIGYTVNNGETCETDEKTLTIVDAPTIVGLTSTQYCNNETASETLTAGDNSGNFALVNTTTGTSTPLAPAIFNPSGLAAGSYRITYTVGSGLLCDESDETETFVINDPPNQADLAINLNTDYCADETNITLSGTYQSNTVTGVFTILQGGTVIEDNASTFDPQGLGEGTYTINFSYTDPSTTCEASRDFAVEVYPLPTAERTDGGASEFCITDDMTYTVVYTVTRADSNTEPVTLGSFTPSMQGVGSFTLSEPYTDPTTGCSISISQEINIAPQAVVEILPLTKAIPDSYCGVEEAEPLRVRIDGVAQDADIFTITNTADGQVIVSNATEFAPQEIKTALESIYGTPLPTEFTLRVAYIFESDCGNKSDTEVRIRFETIEYPERAFVVCPNLLGEPLTARPFNATMPPPSDPVYSWSKDGQNNISTQGFITINSIDDIGKYTVQISDGDGCPKEIWRYNVTFDCETDFVLPNAFSPNGDGLNDLLFPLGKNGNQAPGGDFIKLDWKIFNRWGEIVFVGDDANLVWNGTLRGKSVPDGTYTWTATYQSILEPGKTFSKKGKVTIIR